MAIEEHPGGQEIPAEQVAWAGLPINLDFAFSHAQRDKVYVQHLTRKRWCALPPASPDSDDADEYHHLDAEAG